MTTPTMLQFKVKYQDVYGKPIACDVLHVNDIEEAINVVVDYCLAHSTTWGCEEKKSEPQQLSLF